MLVWPFTLATRERGKCVYRCASGARTKRMRSFSPMQDIKRVVRKTYIVTYNNLLEYLIFHRVFRNTSTLSLFVFLIISSDLILFFTIILLSIIIKQCMLCNSLFLASKRITEIYIDIFIFYFRLLLRNDAYVNEAVIINILSERVQSAF